MPWHHPAPLLLFVLSCPIAGAAEIFRCVAESGELTYSQTPCRGNNVIVETPVERHNKEPADCEYARRSAPATAREVKSGADPSVKESRTAQQAARRAARAKERERKQQCRDGIRSQLDRINSRMRSGYSASQGIRLRERRRDLERRLREC